MEDIKKRISKLVDLKSIISIIMVSAEQFVPLVTMIVTFYFAKQDKPDKE